MSFVFIIIILYFYYYFYFFIIFINVINYGLKSNYLKKTINWIFFNIHTKMTN